MKSESIRLIKLPIRPKLIEGESLPSYIIRVSEMNYFDLPITLYQLAHLTQPGYLDRKVSINLMSETDYSLNRLSFLTGQEEINLWKGTFGRRDKQGNHFLHNNIFIPKYTIKSIKSKVCPLCIVTSPYIRKMWEINLVTVCPEHKCLLLDQCPKCLNMLSFRRNSIINCRCGHALSGEKNKKEVQNEEIQLSSYILSVCGLNEFFKCQDESNPLWSILPDKLFPLLVFMMGQTFRQYRVDNQNWNFNYFQSLNNTVIHNLLSKVITIFEDWPNNFYQFLTNYQTSSPLQTGMKKSFGYFYETIYKNFVDDDYSFLISKFEYFITHIWDKGILSTKIRRIMNIEQIYISAEKASHILGVNYVVLKQMISEGKIEANFIKRKKSSLIRVKESSVRAFREKMDSSLTYKQTIDILGLGPIAIHSLLDHGCIKLFRGPEVDGFTKYMFEQESVLNLINIFKNSLYVSNDNTKNISFRTLQMNNNVGKIVSLVIGGEIKPCGLQEGKGLNKFLFKADDKKIILNRERTNSMTIKDFAILIKTKESHAGDWVKRGFVGCNMINTPVRIKYSEYDLFINNYVTLAEIMKILNTNGRRARRLLFEQNIIALTGPEINGGIGYLFSRAEFNKYLN